MRCLCLVVVLAAGCTEAPAGAARIFDPCAPVAVAAPGASAEQVASLDDAIAMWRADAPGLSLADDAADVAVVFRPGPPAIYGFYDQAAATVYVNTELTDRGQRAVAIAHELGHALGLVHVAPAVEISVMNPGNLTVAPGAADGDALVARWGDCSP